MRLCDEGWRLGLRRRTKKGRKNEQVEWRREKGSTDGECRNSEAETSSICLSACLSPTSISLKSVRSDDSHPSLLSLSPPSPSSFLHILRACLVCCPLPHFLPSSISHRPSHPHNLCLTETSDQLESKLRNACECLSFQIQVAAKRSLCETHQTKYCRASYTVTDTGKRKNTSHPERHIGKTKTFWTCH